MRPNRREVEMSGELGSVHAPLGAVLLARYRLEIILPFLEMRRDYEALGDRRVVQDLDRILAMITGEP
jgi:hypothetical protein